MEQDLECAEKWRTGQCPVHQGRIEPATLGKMEARSAIIHRTIRCATGLSHEPAEQRLSAPTVDSAKATVSRKSQKHRSQRAPDCPVQREDKHPQRSTA
jgi:hypothetical protein